MISKEGTDLDVVDDGGAKDQTDLVYDEDDEILVDSGDKGVLGRELQLVSSDGQSNNSVWQQLARRMIQQDKVDVLVAGFASAEREAIRPIVDQFKQLYFYTNQYEGGVADANTFCTGPVCEQQVIPTVQYMVEKFGPRAYTIAADYNFGQLTAAWTRAYIPLVGGQIIGEEFIPLSVSEFSQVIARIQQAKPDWVMTLLVGQNHHNYYPQAAAAGLKFPMASTVNMAQGYEHKRFKPPSLANMHNAIQYQLEVPTARNRAFVKRWMAMFPDDPYIGEMAQNTYFTIHLYAKAARLAGTTDQETVKKCLELGWNIEAPEGSVFLEPGTHHCAHPIRLAVADENHNVKFVRDWPMIQAWWLQRLGVNLIRNPEYKQYTPDEDPVLQDVRQEELSANTNGRPGLSLVPAFALSASDAWTEAAMDGLAVVLSILYQFGTNAAFLLLSALGLIVILGMMNIINLAHGELMMLGAYTATIGGSTWRAVSDRVSSSPSSWSGVFGAILERTGRATLLRPRARRSGRHLGDQPDPVAGHAAASRAVHAVDPDPGGARSRSGSIPSPVYWLRLIAVCVVRDRCSCGGSTTARRSACRRAPSCRTPRWRARSASTQGGSTC